MQVIINVRMHLGGRGREGGREVHAYAHQMIFIAGLVSMLADV
jgi:hypothetical protein